MTGGPKAVKKANQWQRTRDGGGNEGGWASMRPSGIEKKEEKGQKKMAS